MYAMKKLIRIIAVTAACIVLVGLIGCAAAGQSSASSSQADIAKEQTNLGVLESADGEMVLLLNTEVVVTTTRPETRDDLVGAINEQLTASHKLLDSYRGYADETGSPVVNVMTLNEHFDEGPIQVDRALFDCLDEALTMAELTEGYFNPTVGKLVDVYEGRLEHAGEVQENPTAKAVEDALDHVVPWQELRDHVVLDAAACTVELVPYEGLEFGLSLGAIGKGFALANMELEQRGSYLVSAGTSSMRGHVDEVDDGVTWNVATHVPDGSDLLFAFRLDEGSVSTSGDDESYYLLADGTRVHHILNPFTGYSENHYRNVVLVGENAGVLDALSTALFNVGELEDVLTMIERVEQHYVTDISYCLVIEDGDGYRLEMDDAFKECLIPEYTSGLVVP